MTDAEFRKEKARVDKVLDKWLTMLGLRTWQRVQIEWIRDAEMPIKPHENEVGYPRPAADIEVRWKYLTAYIRICLPEFVDWGDDQVEYVVVHELCHALVNEMREEDPDLSHEERVVTQLAQAFIWVRNSGARDAKKAR